MKIRRWLGMLFIIWFVPGTLVIRAEEPETETRTKAEILQAILTETLPESEYRDMTRCLMKRSYRTVEVLSDRYLLFKGSKDRVWVNRLRHRCPGLRTNQILIFEQFSTSLCATDQVSGTDRGFGRTASCILGRFEKINEQRADALKEAFRQARRS